jgi:hypothetical protein
VTKIVLRADLRENLGNAKGKAILKKLPWYKFKP